MSTYKKKLAYLGGLATISLALTACGSAVASGPEPAELGEVAVASSAEEEIVISEQEHVEKAPGEAGLLVTESDEILFEIVLNSVTPATSCPSRAHDLEETAGNFLILDISASLAEEIVEHTDEPAAEFFFPLLAETFVLYDDDGTEVQETTTLAAWECFDDADLLTSFITPGESHQGLVVLEASVTSGVIAYSPADAPGWQWEF